MKNFFTSLTVVCLLFSSKNLLAQADNNGFYETYIIVNGTYYDLGANTVNPDFSGSPAALSNLACNNFTLNGFEAKLFKCGNCNVTNVRLFYKIYKAGETATFNELTNSGNVNNISGAGAGCTNQQWQNTGANINLISTLGLANGNYIFEDCTFLRTGML